MPKRCVIWCAVSSEIQAKDDKLSLATQESEMRAVADAQGWDIAHVFLWDGYSRWESDPIAALEDFAEQGRFEYHELRRMWRERAFDVLLLYTHSRAGRSFTMQSWVVENVIRHGGEIYRIHGGWINKRDYAFQIGIGGVLSTNDIDRLVEQRSTAMTDRAAKGLPTASRIPFSHLLQRDEYGKPQTDARGVAMPMQVHESLRRLWDDVLCLLLEGVSYRTLEAELYQRFGHVAEDGKPYRRLTMRLILYNPVFWGHSARYHNSVQHGGRQLGAWAYDETISPPTPILVFRNTHPAVYVGEQADIVRAELSRRADVVGRAAAGSSGRFTGLFYCAGCTYGMSYSRFPDGRTYLYCNAHKNNQTCDHRSGLKEETAIAFIDALLRKILDTGSVAAAFQPAEDTRPRASRAQQLEAEIADVEAQAKRLVLKQASAPEALANIYDAELKRLGERLTLLVNALEQDRYSAKRADQEARAESISIGDLRDIGLEAFWKLPPRAINQRLHKLLGDRRFVVSGNDPLPAFFPKPPRKRG